MKNFDFVQTVSRVFTQTICEQLSARMGLAPNVIHHVVELGAVAVGAALIAACRTAQGGSSVYGTLMSGAANPRISEQLGELVGDTAALKDLEASGDVLSRRAIERRIAPLSDQIAMQTGVPPQATHVLVALAAAVGLGALKHHLLIEQAQTSDFVELTAAQAPLIAPALTDDMAAVLGFESASRLLQTGGHFATTAAGPAPVSMVAADPEPARPPAAPSTYGGINATVSTTASSTVVPASRMQPSVFSPPPMAAPEAHVPNFSQKVDAPAAAAVGEPAPIDEATDAGRATPIMHKATVRTRRSRRGLAWLLALLALGTVGAFAYEQTHPGFLKAAISPSTDSVSSPASAPAAASRVGVAVETPAGERPVEVSATSVAAASSAVAASSSTVPGVGDAATPAPEAVANTAAFRVDDGGSPHFAGTVAGDEQRDTLMRALKDRFGAGRFTADVKVVAGARADWMDHLDTLVALMAVRGAEVELHSSAIELAGSATTAGWPARVQQAFGSPWQVTTFSAAERVDAAARSFRHAMAATLDDGQPCQVANVVRVLNMQIIDFAHSSAHVPTSAKDTLGDSALLLKTCANVGHPVKVRIAAYADSLGDREALVQLARKRADSVLAYLVANGAPAALLTAEGYGAEKPIASNLTSIGRFENRRIEFAGQ
ncbi:OmpA family protein [Burkholderia latens]|uniref:OmpA family protein n=1 Tax=Burkholderia latens TaxID=488446 RepID=A0A6H9TIC2_9BURK|nr:OmpA family protein [Burkholderia latens]KAB0644804.1 OmpA family protein [Burkholderia latens]VWB17146.1 OmpA/MotB [Burkholderia latens]